MNDDDWSGGDPGVPFIVERPPFKPMQEALPLLRPLGHEVVLYRTDDLSREQWQLRRFLGRKIGASNVAAIMQRHPYSTPIQTAMNIKGLADAAFGPEELFRIEIGTVCESQVRRIAANAMQIPVLNPGVAWPKYLSTWPQVLQHPTIPCFTCNLDGVVFLDDEILVLECKWTSWRNKAAWRALADTNDISATIGTSVFAYWLQVQSQLAITGLKRGILIGILGEDAACRMLLNIVQGRTDDDTFDPKPYDVVQVTIERDEPTIAAIEKVVPRFHKRFIEGDEIPPTSGPADIEALRTAYRVANPPQPILLRTDLDDLARRYRSISSEISRGEKLKKERYAELLRALTESSVEAIDTGKHSITYKANVNKVRSLRVSPKDENE